MREEGIRGERSCAGEKQNRRGKLETDDDGVFRRVRARLRQGEVTGKKGDLATRRLGRGVISLDSASPDDLKVAPDASGDHWTKTQRGFQSDRPPDDDHRTLALVSVP